MPIARFAERVEKWDIVEIVLEGPSEGNPFVDVSFGARFRHGHRVVPVDGFYDGKGRYVVRYSPDTEGEWSFETTSNVEHLVGQMGQFTCVSPAADNHGPVGVRNRYHFAYADGTPYKQIGTTCYAWVHQGDALEEQTLSTLARAPFNKMRMCVFPKHYAYNENEPDYYAYERDENGVSDFTRFDPAFWKHFELRVGQLRDMGIEADLILFHPYDRWGYADMGAEADDRYLRYIVARLGAYRNVWWSFANEYDLMPGKCMADWDRCFKIVQTHDPYQRLRSIHNCRAFYDHGKPWVTHQSVQHSDVERTEEWRQLYGKPVVIDECKYEGNIHRTWGNITAVELVRRFWETTCRGGYCGHGETYLDNEDILWWSKGGVLHGDSPARIAFLREILEEGPAEGLDPIAGITVGGRLPCVGRRGAYYLIYTGVAQPGVLFLKLPEGERCEIDVIDTWGIAIEHVPGVYEGEFELRMPTKPFMAVRLRVI